jgi:hypothetical protein
MSMVMADLILEGYHEIRLYNLEQAPHVQCFIGVLSPETLQRLCIHRIGGDED